MSTSVVASEPEDPVAAGAPADRDPVIALVVGLLAATVEGESTSSLFGRQAVVEM
jgi:hypothetical protein